MFADGPGPRRPNDRGVSPLWIIGVVLVVIAVWNEFEQHKARKLRPAVSAEPTRLRIIDEEPIGEAPRAPVVPQGRPTYRPAPAAAPAAAAPTAPPPRVQTLYLCKSYGGSMFWSKTICHQLRATIDRIAKVPGALPFDEQVAIARGEAQAAAALAQPPPLPGVVRDRPARQSKTLECRVLDEQIQRIDAAARQPQPGYAQDSLKDQRMRARSRQAQLRC